MANPTAAPSAIRHLPVLDAPSPWMQQFIATVDPDTRLELFKSSKQLKEMVLGNSSKVRLQQNLNHDLTGVGTATRLQLLAGCRDGAEVQLLLDASKPTNKAGPDGAPWASLWLANVCAFMMSSPSLLLHHVTYLELEGAMCDELVPPSVTAACPNLHHIKHTHYRPWLRQYNMMTPIFICPQVQRLTLCSELPPDANHTGAELFRLQLQALPNLQDVSLGSFDHNEKVLEEFWRHGISSVQQHITSFELSGEHDFPSLFNSKWPQLRRLVLHNFDLNHSSIKTLSFNMPQMSTLRLHSVPDWPDAYAADPWAMAIPSLRHFSMYTISMGSLAELSLKGLESFHFSELELETYNEPHAPVAIENVKSCTEVGGYEGQLEVGDAWLATRPPMYCGSIVPVLMPLLKQLSFRVLRLPMWVLLTDGCSTLFSQLPQLQVLEFHTFCHRQEEHRLLPRVIALCVQARWPATLRIHSYWVRLWGQGWLQQLIEAMQAAGHQHISFELC